MTSAAQDDSSLPQGLPRHKWLFRIIAVAIPSSIGIALLIVVLVWQERLARDPDSGWWRFQTPPIYLFEPGYQVSGQVAVYDEELGWTNVPSSVSTTFGRELTINSKGHRGPERSFAKPPGISRILVLGDSYTWGYGVADQEVFPALLQQELQTAPTTWQVLNAGVSGWGTDQEYLYLRAEGFRYEPTIVVLALFVGNDPSENMFSVRYGLQKPVFLDTQLNLANVPVPKPGQNIPNQRSSAGPAELTVAIVKGIKQACQQHDCDLVVMKFGSILLPPDINQTGDPVMREVVAEIGLLEQQLPAVAGALYLDLDHELVAKGVAADSLIQGNDHHWNALGHQWTAQLLHEFLVQNELVP